MVPFSFLFGLGFRLLFTIKRCSNLWLLRLLNVCYTRNHKVLCRYVADFRLALKARGPCKQWWEETLRPLRAAEIEATNAFMAALASPPAHQASQQPPSKDRLATEGKQAPGKPAAASKAKEVRLSSISDSCGPYSNDSPIEELIERMQD